MKAEDLIRRGAPEEEIRRALAREKTGIAFHVCRGKHVFVWGRDRFHIAELLASPMRRTYAECGVPLAADRHKPLLPVAQESKICHLCAYRASFYAKPVFEVEILEIERHVHEWEHGFCDRCGLTPEGAEAEAENLGKLYVRPPRYLMRAEGKIHIAEIGRQWAWGPDLVETACGRGSSMVSEGSPAYAEKRSDICVWCLTEWRRRWPEFPAFEWSP